MAPLIVRRAPDAGRVHELLAHTGCEVLARVYAARAVQVRDLDAGLGALLPPRGLGQLEPALDLLQRALRERQRILVVGDYDADGATSTALALRGLRALGAGPVDYLVPSRFRDGYGLSPALVAVAAERGAQLILTVDNGVSAFAGVAAAAEYGIPVLVTDHHLPGRQLPGAAAIVNPCLAGAAFESKCLAGVGVLFYLLLALRARLREAGWFDAARPEPRLADWLDLVALGTVADVVPLDRNNRLLVGQGLRRIRAGRAVPGIGALLAVAGREAGRVQASDLGFAVGPRLNAAGRLDDMSLGIECLLADDADAALTLAERLDALNRERRELEGEMRAQALDMVDRLELDGDLPAALCLHDTQWHQGMVGLVAARVRERVHRPVIAFAPAADGSLKGSGRSIPGLHLRDALADVAALEPELMAAFGGHAMAAGLTLERSRLERFSAAFERAVAQRLGADALQPRLHSDGPLAAGQADLALARRLTGGGPWGQGFEEPLFDNAMELLESRVVGGNHLRCRLRWPGQGAVIEGIGFGLADAAPPRGPVHLAYRLAVNEWRGAARAELRIEAFV